MSLFDPRHPFNAQEDTKEVCEWIDAGIFSGDLLHVCDIEEFKEYVERWNRAIKEQEEYLKNL